jgi:hypothetical protein
LNDKCSALGPTPRNSATFDTKTNRLTISDIQRQNFCTKKSPPLRPPRLTFSSALRTRL